MNKIIYLDNEDEKLMSDIPKDSFVVRIDGENIIEEKDFLFTMAECFHFPVYDSKNKRYMPWYESAYRQPSRYTINWDVFNDWMLDLSWINANSIRLIIFNYKNFLKCSISAKQYFEKYFFKILLPWWEKDVSHCVVEGKPKEFMVYCIK